MEQVVGGLMAIGIVLAIIYAFVKAALAPINEKLDRLLALHERAKSL
jgi:hypothetical protein